VGTSEATTVPEALKHKDCVSQSVSEVLNASCGITLQPEEYQPVADLASNGAVLAVISLVGSVEWSICLGLPKDTACALTEKFAGFEIPFDSDDMGDAVGELVNVLAGEVKLKLDKRGVKAELSLPSVIRGKRMHIIAQKDLPSATFCFTSEIGRLWSEVIAGTNVAETRQSGG